MINHYQVLGLFSTKIDCSKISEAEIKKAYRNKALELHPDKSNGNDASAFQQLQASYSVLMDKELREEFDHEWQLKRQKEQTKARKEKVSDQIVRAKEELRKKEKAAHDEWMRKRKKEKSEWAKQVQEYRKWLRGEREVEKEEKGFDYDAWMTEMIERRNYEREVFEHELRLKKEEKERKEREILKAARGRLEKKKAENELLKMRVMKVRWDKEDNGDFNEHQIREIFEYFGEVEDVRIYEKKNNTCVALVVMESIESMVAAAAARWDHLRPRFAISPLVRVDGT